uniref:Uncharacterized protein n=1 Tax=Avena sativa TaxID=4498 RepID=A0ACD5V371_AVESA
MMQRNPRAYLRAATAAVPRALQTNTARAPPPTRRPIFPAGAPHRAFSTSRCYHGKVDVDIKELPGAYSYVMDVPDLRASDLTVKLVHMALPVPDRWLDVIAERGDGEETGCSYLRKDRPVGKFHRRFGLPCDADLGSVSAVCRDGVLTVTIQKLPPVVIPRTIEVKS